MNKYYFKVVEHFLLYPLAKAGIEIRNFFCVLDYRSTAFKWKIQQRLNYVLFIFND